MENTIWVFGDTDTKSISKYKHVLLCYQTFRARGQWVSLDNSYKDSFFLLYELITPQIELLKGFHISPLIPHASLITSFITSSPQGAEPHFQHKPFFSSYCPHSSWDLQVHKWPWTRRNFTLPWHLLEEKEEHGWWGRRRSQELRWVWVDLASGALVSQTLSSAAVSASPNVIVLWSRHQQAQLSWPSPCCSLSQESKLSLLCTSRLYFKADNCISNRHCVRLEEGSLSERSQRGGFGTWDWEMIALSSCFSSETQIASSCLANKRVKRGERLITPFCKHGFPLSFSAKTRQKTLFMFAWVLIQTGGTKPWHPAHC